MLPSTEPTAGNPASPALVFPAAYKGSGPTGARQESVHSPLPPGAQLYAESFGWPITMEGGEVMVMCGDVLDVTTMPVGFGGEVNQLLRVHLLMAPIVEVRAAKPDESSTWAFFSQPKQPTPNDDQLLKLSTCGVKHLGAGTTFPLPPSPTCGSEELRWIVPPPFGALKSPLPPWESIAACGLKARYRAIGR